MKNLKRIIEYGLYMFVFLLPWQTRWIIHAGEINAGASEYLTISLYGADILLIILLLLFALYKNAERGSKTEKKSKIQKIWYFIAGLEFIIFISIFIAPDKLIALYAYARFLLGIGLFWLVVSAEYERIKLISAFLSGVFLTAGLGIWQFLSQSSFAGKWLGLASHNAGDLGVSVVEILSGGRWLRAYGGLDHPNMLGGVLAIGIILMIYIFLNRDGRRNNNKQFSIFNFQFSNNFQFLIFNFLILVFSAALFFSFSRAAWLGIIVGIGVMLAMAIIKKDFLAQKKILEVILISGVLIFILFNIYGDLAAARFSDNTRLEVKSNTDRIESLEAARAIIREKWFLGAGIGNYVKYSADLASCESSDQCQTGRPAWSFQPTHNVFLLVWAEIGILGLLFFLGILFWAGKSALRVGKNGLSANKKYTLGLLAVLLTMFMFDHWLWSLHFGVFLFWLIMGIIAREDAKEKA